MNGFFLSTDLMFTSRVVAAAAAAGAPAQVVGSPAKLLEKAAESPIDYVLIDLGRPALNVTEFIAALKNLEVPPQRILAYGAHVHEALLQAATEAGCDAVFTRGQFSGNMPAIFGNLATPN